MSGGATPHHAQGVYAFTDTNLLLEFQLFTDIDWRTVVDASDVDILVQPRRICVPPSASSASC